MIRTVSVAFLAIALAASSALGAEPRKIGWDDLMPDAPPLTDPFQELTADQKLDVGTIAWAQEMLKSGRMNESSRTFEDSEEIARKLKKQGLNVDDLLWRQEQFLAEIDRRGEQVVGDLEGQLVRMPGYALPLEFSEAGVREFLLVPYIGACIHVPPPPPNQIVFVELDKKFQADDLYSPVWVTGRMTVKRSDKPLAFVDGQSNVATGYELKALKVEPIKE